MLGIKSQTQPTPPRQQLTRKNTANRIILFCNARNEKYIVEWAIHHLLLGFDTVFIYDHKSNVPIASRVSFGNRIIVKRVEKEGPIKLDLMRASVNIAKQMGYDFMLYLDADEFLCLNYFKDVKEMLRKFHFADTLAINWLMFGSNHLTKDPPNLLIEGYTKSEEILDQHVKTFVRPEQVIQVLNPHCYSVKNPNRMFCMPMRKMYSPYQFNNTQLSYKKVGAYIAHYIYQSEETYKKRKVALPADDTGGFRSLDPNIHLHHNVIENYDLKLRYSKRIKNFMEVVKSKKLQKTPIIEPPNTNTQSEENTSTSNDDVDF